MDGDLINMTGNTKAEAEAEAEETKSEGKEKEPTIKPLHFLYSEGIKLFRVEFQTLAIPDITCKTTGYHKLYAEVEPIGEKGLNYPPGFKYYRPLNLEEHRIIQDRWLSRGPVKGPEVFEFWNPMFFPKSANATTPLQMYTLQMIELQSIYDTQLSGTTHDIGVSFSPNDCVATEQFPRAFLPEKSWFCDRLRDSDLTHHDILTLFPEAEADLLALCFGRAVVGRTGHIPVGRAKPIEHTFRTMPILFGAEPGQGKSTLANFIINALKSVGYTIANFNSMSNRFNLGSVINAHIALTS